MSFIEFFATAITFFLLGVLATCYAMKLASVMFVEEMPTTPETPLNRDLKRDGPRSENLRRIYTAYSQQQNKES